MNKKIQTFLTHHQFYQYLDYDKYLPHLESQVESALSKHNQNQIHFPHTWSDSSPLESDRDYLALDLGGMYLRMHHCRIKKGKLSSLSNHKTAFYQNKTYTPEILFSSLTRHLQEFTGKMETIPDHLVFSFANALKPLFRKKNLLDGEILFWGKNHRQEGLLGLHLGNELENYLRSHGFPSISVHLINDSSLALLSAKMSQKIPTSTVINLVVGSGTNISVGYDHGKSYKLINMEFGNFDFIPYSNFDFQVNHESSTPNKFRTEKLFTGAWQTMLFRTITARAVAEGLFSEKIDLSKLQKFNSEELEKYFAEPHPEMAEFSDLQFIWRQIGERGAFICALGLFTILQYLIHNQLTREGVTLMEVGALIEHSHNFRKTMEKYLKKLLEQSKNMQNLQIETILSSDPTCEGAATLLSLCE